MEWISLRSTCPTSRFADCSPAKVYLINLIGLCGVKVFSDGSLYLTDLQLSFSGNYSCQAVNNPTVKQTHVVHVIVNPIVEVSPRFQWTPIGGVASFECRYETFEDDYEVHWFKNDEKLVDGSRVTILNNGTRLQVAALEQTDTGAYTCRVVHRSEAASGQSVASLLVQDETVEAASTETRPQRLWIFHATGLSIFEGKIYIRLMDFYRLYTLLLVGICGQPIHEIDARDTIYQNSLTLCGNGVNGQESASALGSCQWSDDVIELNDHVFIAQPNLNRIVVFQASQLTVVQVIATDPQPSRLWAMEGGKENQIWVLCDGNSNYFEEQQSSSSRQTEDNFWPGTDSSSSSSSTADGSSSSGKFDFLNEKYLKNRKTIQVVRLPEATVSGKSSEPRRSRRQADVIHLQPVDGHFDLVYDLFMPNHYESIFKNDANKRVRSVMQESPYAYATHWEERSLVKISLKRLEYMQSIRLADCQPIAASIITRRSGGLVAVQCQTPVTHQLNGQLILDQVTDAILSHNLHLNAHQSYLSPDHRYLVNILHEHSNSSSCSDATKCSHPITGQQSSATSTSTNTSTIIVQRISDNGIEFMYDVRTSLDIVSCSFVWKNGNYDLVLASGTRNREDLLYLSLIDGHVELVSGIGRPTEG